MRWSKVRLEGERDSWLAETIWWLLTLCSPFVVRWSAVCGTAADANKASSDTKAVVYTVLSRLQLEELVEGGTDLLYNPVLRRLGCSLLGRPITPAGLILLQAICRDRGLVRESL